MASVKVKNEIRVYEVDGKDVPLTKNLAINVESHWNSQDFVVLEVAGKKYTVAADDFHVAIVNAKNSGR